ncbi:HNH endonuclease [Leifsonia sp. EB34]|uniref:HNH endonuclease n=1 Tax=Leifsonia sp. EB34 TaxID=3156303 RepID=UPI0035128F6E
MTELLTPAAEEPDPWRRFGPLERAIRHRDPEAWLTAARERCSIDPEDPDACWVWTGARHPAGYPIHGHRRTFRFAHRVAAWTRLDFVGEYSRLGPVHHVCGVRSCVNPSHLEFVTALTNVLESKVRNALLTRIAQLTDALRALDAEHPLLQIERVMDVGAMTTRVPQRGVISESARFRAQRAIRARAREDGFREHERKRFLQVIEVERLTNAGMRQKDALLQVNISRTAFSEYRIRLRNHIAQQDR